MFALQLADVPGDGGSGYALLVFIAFDVLAFSGPAIGDIRRPDAEVPERFAEFGVEIDGVVNIARAVAPAAAFGSALHPAFDAMVVDDAYILQGTGSANPTGQIDLDARGAAFAIRETQHAAMRGGGAFGFYLVFG
jgi:hypothetical protein